MKTKGQKLFSIVNIIWGVILSMSGGMLLADSDTTAGGLIVLPLGMLCWIMGAVVLKKLRTGEAEYPDAKKALLTNKILFFVSSVICLASVVLVLSQSVF